MKTPRKHAVLIKQWADGATIQFKPHNCLHDWKEVDGIIGWHDWCDYRVKPEPRSDVVRYAVASKLEVKHVGPVNSNPCNNVMFVFDGETGELKDCQVLAKG